jgi:hypothetical protein
MMAIAASDAPDRVVNVAGSPVDTWTYKTVLEDMVDYMSWAQNEAGTGRGGWRYTPNYSSSDNSVSGFAVLGLGYAEAPSPWGFGLTIPAFVKTELNIWIDYIQNDTSGGSGYTDPGWWVNILKTGNLLYEMAFVGDTASTPRVQNAVAFIVNNWDAGIDTGWKGTPAYYQAMYCTMKGLEALGITTVGTHDWFDEFSDAIVAQQETAGSWAISHYTYDKVLSSEFAMLTMQKAVPPPRLSLVPVMDTNPVNTSHELTATLVDANGVPMPGETITFTVTGVNPTSGTAVTDTSGVATWSYTGTNPGTDTIVATGAGVTSNEAKKTWTSPAVPGITGWGIMATVIALGGVMMLAVRRRWLVWK